MLQVVLIAVKIDKERQTPHLRIPSQLFFTLYKQSFLTQRCFRTLPTPLPICHNLPNLTLSHPLHFSNIFLPLYSLKIRQILIQTRREPCDFLFIAEPESLTVAEFFTQDVIGVRESALY